MSCISRLRLPGLEAWSCLLLGVQTFVAVGVLDLFYIGPLISATAYPLLYWSEYYHTIWTNQLFPNQLR